MGKDGPKTVHKGYKTALEGLQGTHKRAWKAKIIEKPIVFL